MRTISSTALTGSVLLSGVAGYVDAIGFVLSGGFFVSFMSGNSTQASVDISKGNVTAALLAVSLIVGFVGGVIIGHVAGLLLAESHVGERLIMLSLALLAATLIVSAWPRPGFSLIPVASVMGALNTLIVADGRPRVAVTYATGTLVSFGLSIAERLVARKRGAWVRPLVLWAGITCGAAVGSVAWTFWGAWALVPAAVMLMILGIIQAARNRHVPLE